MGVCWAGFRTFFKIGLFTIGGGYAMIPLIKSEVVERKKWMSEEEFLDLLALSQALPGVFAVNFSIYIGNKLKGARGSVALALGVVLPSFLIMLAVAMFFVNFAESRVVEAIFKGVRPAVVALLAGPCVNLARTAHITIANVWLPIFAALLIWILGVSPIYIILLVGVGGFTYGMFTGGDDRRS